ncbi:RNA methylase [Cryptosporidium ubiquitum]|uniref:Cap-specific mRNA (nucleoside-2'-O-)-methyltransferase 2 n=1 Tax=Cryptosporidium ubiquitum TaxID=857276 RepID=A0A1J4MIP2_9CRYT|nr:RNA methylase [Cryptosporidium ubiquitum]OII74130.1 RNA methylase [Cryptosporidium ubiquitum]
MVKPEFRIYSFPSSETIKPRIPFSEAPCSNCTNKSYECNCNAIKEGLGKYGGYTIKELDSLKSQLDSVRNELDLIDINVWQSFTRTTNIAQDVIYKLRDVPIELATTGWCKLYEILHYFRWHEYMNEAEYHSMHLCECPGGFISALNHYIHSNVINKRQRLGSSKLHWEWKANSLNPYFEGNNPNSILTDDIIYRDTYRAWNMGADDSGDITKLCNIDYIWQRTSKNTKSCWLADLVTADGSLDIQYNPNDQEKLTSSIQYCETVCALGILRKHGSFIIKCFNILHHTTISIIALLCYCFQNVHIVKPVMSKGGSGEIYIVAMDFQGIRSVLLKALISHFQGNRDKFDEISLFPRDWLPEEFIEQCITAATLFSRWQIDHIAHNLLKFKSSIVNDPSYKKMKFLNFESLNSTCNNLDESNNVSEQNKGELFKERYLFECAISKREKRIFALEYIQNLGISSIPTSQYILPNLQHRKEYLNSTSLSRRGGDRNRVQGIFIDRKYAFQQYMKLQETRNKFYFPSMSFFKLVSSRNINSFNKKLLFFIDEIVNQNENIDSESNSNGLNDGLSRIPLKKVDIELNFTQILPKERLPKKISPKWFVWSKEDIAYQRLIDRLKSQTYMFESENFFKKVQDFTCVSLQMSPYCDEDLIQRFCETITAINSPIKKITFGIDACVHNEFYNNILRWTTIPFDTSELLDQKENNSVIYSSIHGNKFEMNYQQDSILNSNIIDDLPLYCQIPANIHILGLFETIRELKRSECNDQCTISEYLGKIKNYVEIYNGVAYHEVLEDHSKFPLTFLLNIDSKSHKHGTIIIISDEETDELYKDTNKTKFNRCNDLTFIDISKEFKYCNQYKQIINAITEDYNIKKNEYDLIYIDSYWHLVPTFSLGQFEVEESFNLVTNIMIALNLIKFGGNIIISLKTALTRFTAGIIIVLSSVFDKIALSKPYSSSSPCYSNFYLICSGFNDNSNTLSRHFFQFLWDVYSINNRENSSMVQCVPPTLFASDNFLHWLKEFNNEAILCDIELLEAVIEQQESSDNLEPSVLDGGKNHKDSEYSSNWEDFPNRVRIQREILRYILIGGNSLSSGENFLSFNGETIKSDVIPKHKEIQETSHNIDEKNLDQFDVKILQNDDSFSNFTEQINVQLEEFKSNRNIDPFEDRAGLNEEIDVFCITPEIEPNDPFDHK